MLFLAIAQNQCEMGPESGPGGSQIDPPEAPKWTLEALGGILGGLVTLLGGSLGSYFIRKGFILEVKNRPRSVFLFFYEIL